jgi:hypothetical protein
LDEREREMRKRERGQEERERERQGGRSGERRKVYLFESRAFWMSRGRALASARFNRTERGRITQGKKQQQEMDRTNSRTRQSKGGTERAAGSTKEAKERARTPEKSRKQRDEERKTKARIDRRDGEASQAGGQQRSERLLHRSLSSHGTACRCCSSESQRT